MRIKDVNLGGGLFRLDTEPTRCGEDVRNVPTHVMDDIMRDVVRRMENKRVNDWDDDFEDDFTEEPWVEAPRFNEVNKDFTRPLPFDGAEDGIDIHVDKPRREMYGGWDAEYGFHKDMKAYNRLKEAAKECNWPCREPMRGTPNYVNHNVRPQVAPQPKRVEKPVDAREFIEDVLEDLRNFLNL